MLDDVLSHEHKALKAKDKETAKKVEWLKSMFCKQEEMYSYENIIYKIDKAFKGEIPKKKSGIVITDVQVVDEEFLDKMF